MRWTGWWWIPLAVAALAFVGCTNGTNPDDQVPVHPPPTVQNPPDGGVGVIPRDGGTTTGDTDGGGTGGEDAGTGTGTDGGTQVTEIAFPQLPGWQFFGPQHGGPREVWGVSADDGGNIWVAGGGDGLYLLTPGADRFLRFTHADGLGGVNGQGFAVISVSGGPSGTVYVGYRGVESGGFDEADPMWMQKTGDADKVVWNGAGLSVTHYDISSPPGLYAQYPDGREKIRHVHRLLHDRSTGNVWFGGNHGVGMYEHARKTVWEHQHAHINGYKQSAAADPSGASYTMLSGDWMGIALDGNGDFWMGGGHRIGRINYASEGGQYWASVNPIIDVWPDAQPDDARPELRTDDLVSDLLVSPGGDVWVGSIPNGLARVNPTTLEVTYIPKSKLADPAVTALERDPKDGSLWVGHLWGGLTRIRNGEYTHVSQAQLGHPLVDMVVNDLQSFTHQGNRRILVAFSGGAVGIYTGE
jgi:hypothetical protein